MSGYSMAAEPIGDVRPRDIWILLDVLRVATFRDLSFIEARYTERAFNFRSAIALAEAMGWVRQHDGRCVPLPDVAERASVADDEERAALFAEALLGAAKPYQRAFARFLAQFKFRDGEFICRPGVQQRLRDASVRNFLIELGAVTYRPATAEYALESDFAAWTPWAQGVIGPSAEVLASQVADRSAVGLVAELAAMDWERARLGAQYCHRIRHVAQDYPAAGFDIQSLTVAEGRCEPRFIEVKAVSRDDLAFHWSRSEVEAAAALGERYFLYLVSLGGPQKSHDTHVEVVANAYRSIYGSPSSWRTSIVDTVCRKESTQP